LETNDGSDAVVTVTNDKRAGFDAAVKGTKNTDDVEWNNSMKEYALGFELSHRQENLLSSMNSDWARRAAIDYWKTGNLGAGVCFALKEALSQWTNPELVVTGLAAGVAGYSAFAPKGITQYLYHYTSEAAAQNIVKTGLKTGRDGFVYLTNKANLTPLQAQIELALPADRALPTSILRIDASGLSPSVTRSVQGNLPGMGAGGGTEFLFNHDIPAYLIQIIK
jgi:hypothetical protein